MIGGTINVTEIDKSKLYDGTKGKYLNIVLIPTPNNKYGDYMIVQGVTKEERLAGQKGKILGNAKILSRGTSTYPEKKEPEAAKDDDEIPF